MKNLSLKWYRAIVAIALMVTTININTACMFFFYQPKLPEGAEILKKF